MTVTLDEVALLMLREAADAGDEASWMAFQDRLAETNPGVLLPDVGSVGKALWFRRPDGLIRYRVMSYFNLLAGARLYDHWRADRLVPFRTELAFAAWVRERLDSLHPGVWSVRLMGSVATYSNRKLEIGYRPLVGESIGRPLTFPDRQLLCRAPAYHGCNLAGTRTKHPFRSVELWEHYDLWRQWLALPEVKRHVPRRP